MKTRIFLSGCLILLSFIFINGCAKDGAIGPAGTNGSSGTNGANGTNGKDGTNGVDGKDGKDGNANVSSVIVTPTWYWDATNKMLKADINPLLILTTAVSDKGVVLVYYKNESGNWIPLPRTIYDQSQRFSYTPYWLVLVIQNSDNTQPSPLNLPFKIVCIEASAGKRNILDGVDKSDYYAVCKALNLKP